MKTPTAFVVLKDKLPPLEEEPPRVEDEQLTVKVKANVKENGKVKGNVVAGGALPDEVNHRVKQAKAWLKFCSDCAEGVLEFLPGPLPGRRKARPSASRMSVRNFSIKGWSARRCGFTL